MTAVRRVEAADQHTVRVQQVLDRSAFREELRVRQNLEFHVRLAVGLQNGAHRGSCAAWHSRFLDNDFRRFGDAGNATSRRFDIAAELGKVHTYRRSAAYPLPTPDVFVGVLTLTNTICASSIAPSMSVVKNRLRPRHSPTTSARPGSNTGSCVRSSEFHAAMRCGLTSTIVTLISGHCWAMMEQVGPPTYPAPMQQIEVIFSGTMESKGGCA